MNTTDALFKKRSSLEMNTFRMVSGHFPRTIAPNKLLPRTILLWTFAPWVISSQVTAPDEIPLRINTPQTITPA